MRTFFIAALLLFTNTTFASPELAEEFKSTWFSGYKEGKCGQNVMDLVTRAEAKGIDMTRAKMLNFTNDGYTMSVMHRRNAGEPLKEPKDGIRFTPGIRNFYFHVVLEYDGYVYDYDFGNEPQIVPVKEYIRRMFWEEPNPLPKYTIFDRLDARKKYKVTVLSALEYINRVENPSTPEHNLNDFFESLMLIQIDAA